MMFYKIILYSRALSVFVLCLSCYSLSSLSFLSLFSLVFSYSWMLYLTSSISNLIFSIYFCFTAISTFIWSLLCLVAVSYELAYFFSSYVPLNNFLSIKLRLILYFLYYLFYSTVENLSKVFNLYVRSTVIDFFLDSLSVYSNAIFLNFTLRSFEELFLLSISCNVFNLGKDILFNILFISQFEKFISFYTYNTIWYVYARKTAIKIIKFIKKH